MLFVKESSKLIFYALLECEEDCYNATNVYFKLLAIHTEFTKNANPRFSNIIKACTDKLEKYLFHGGMPSMNFFKAIRILDPLYFKLNEVNINEIAIDFPELKSCFDEIVNYKLLCQDLRDTIDIKEFWLINKVHLPQLFNLAKIFLHFPISTASVERSFSKYNNLLANDRLRLKPETLKALIFLYYNKNVVSQDEEQLDDEEEEFMILQLGDEDSLSGVEEL